MPTFAARAYAKINLGLRVLGRRSDGYHELRTVFQTLRLADRLRVKLERGRGIELQCRPARGAVDARWLCAPPGRANLAWRAAECALEAFGLRAHVSIELEKHIPLQSGLGGGSSDAATVIEILAAAAPRRPSPQRIWEVAAALGADVPFFLVGGAAVGAGRGEEIYPLPDLPAWPCVLVLPRQHRMSTPRVFAAWDAVHPQAARTPAAVSAKITFCGSLWRALPVSRPRRDRGSGRLAFAPARPKVRAGIANDLEEVVFPLSPDFRAIHRALAAAPVLWTAMSGSGAAQFALFADWRRARTSAVRLRQWGPVWVTALLGRKQYARRLNS